MKKSLTNPHDQLYQDTLTDMDLEGLALETRAKIAYAGAAQTAHEIAKDLLQGWESDAPELTIQRLETLLEHTSADHLRGKIFGRSV